MDSNASHAHPDDIEQYFLHWPVSLTCTHDLVNASYGQHPIHNYQWPYVYNLLTNSTLGMTDSTLGVYPGPAGPANSNHVLGGDVLVVPKGATNMDAIAKFANFLLASQAQKDMLLNLSWVAVNSGAYDNLPANFSAVGTALQQAISQGVFLRNPAPWINQWSNWRAWLIRGRVCFGRHNRARGRKLNQNRTGWRSRVTAATQ